MLSELPLVSAIMPTADRHEFAREAVRMFLAQDYPNAELIVLDDGKIPLDLAGIETEGRVTLQRSPVKRVIGKKRNLACSMAAGEIIVHWDDDDIYSADRISDQVARLLENPEAEMTGYNVMSFMATDGAIWEFDPEIADYAIGVSMCYRKAAWRERPFPEISTGEDGAFWRGRRCVSVPAGDHIVARIHAANTSYKDTREQGWRRIA